jgi:hypothetical protein
MSAQLQETKTLFGLKTTPVQKTALQQKVDRLGEIEEILKEVKDLITEKEKIRKSLLADTESLDSGEEAVLDGMEYTVVFSPCAKKRQITNVERYFEAVGQDVFLNTVDIPIGKAEKYLSPLQQDELIQVSQGSRTLKAVVRKH